MREWMMSKVRGVDALLLARITVILCVCACAWKASGGRAQDMQLLSATAADNALNYSINERICLYIYTYILHVCMPYYVYVRIWSAVACALLIMAQATGSVEARG